ncbi:MAG: Fe-S cluster assembly protein SufD [Myxococcales bacterium]|nr:Fe-S cluster assembly protein SufD [Myxococcales bacterium]
MSGPLLERFEDARERLPGHGLPWLEDLRQGAFEHFRATGMPAPTDEDWRFTNLAPLRKHDFTPTLLAPATRSPERPEGTARARIVFRDGRFDPAHGTPDALPAGVSVRSLAHVLRDDPDRVRARLGQIADPKSRALWALNTAWFEDGALIEVAGAAKLDAPIEVEFLQSGDGSKLVTPRCLILMGPGSRAAVCERYRSTGAGPYLTNALSEAVLETDASLVHVRIQEESSTGFHLGGFASRQEAGSRLQQISIALGSRLSRFEISSLLEGEGADCALDGLYLAKGRQHVDHHTTIDHAVPHCTSRELYKGILAGQSRAVFHGRIQVRPHAQKTSASQTNRNLVISPDARVNTKPQLEILNNDVRCTHGATIGQIEEEALFYLQSRGIGPEEARALLCYAFASEVAERIPDQATRDWLRDYVDRWIREPGP